MTTRPRATQPLPAPNPDTEEFWAGCKAHEFRIQRCKNCGTFRHYPRPACHMCQSFEIEYVKCSGRGIIYSYTVAYHAFNPFFADKVPYAVIVVELDDAPGARMASNMVDCPIESVKVGMPVDVVWEDVNDQITIYKFRPAD